jgi:hypothetical protein
MHDLFGSSSDPKTASAVPMLRAQSSSNKASARSSLPFSGSSDPSAPGSTSVFEEYGSSKTWRSVRLASNCFASVSAYRSATIDSGRRSVGTRIVFISTGDHRLISPLSSMASIIERVFVLATRTRLFLRKSVETGYHIEEFLVNRTLALAVEGPVQIGQQRIDILLRALHGGEAACVLAG